MAIETIFYTDALRQVIDYAGADIAIEAANNKFVNPTAWTNLCNNAGVNVYTNSAGEITGYFKTVEGAANIGQTATAQYGNAVLEVVESDGTITLQTLSETTTAGGETISAGGSLGGMTAGQFVGAAAIGIGIGLKSYRDYPEFWNDLSDSIFGVGDENFLEVMQRATQNGIKNYAKKSDIENVVQQIYHYTPLEDKIIVNRPPSTQTLFKTGGSGIEFLYATFSNWLKNDPDSGQIAKEELDKAYYQSYNYFKSQYPTYEPNTIYISINGSIRSTNITIRFGYKPIDEIVNLNRQSLYDSIIIPISTSLSSSYSNGIYIDSTGGHKGNQEFRTSYVEPISTNTIGSSIFSKAEIVNDAVIVNPDATISPSAADLWNTFPEWANSGFTTESYDPITGNRNLNEWLPLTFLNTNPFTDNQPVTGNQTEYQQGLFNEDAFKNFFKTFNNYMPQIPNINLPDTPKNDTPVNPGATGGFGATQSLFTVYNPTQSEVNGVGSYLWTENIIELIQKFFQNPMDAIISLHMIYCTPTTNGRKNIKLGYLDSGVASDVVSNQYEVIDCGTLYIPEYYGDVKDYDYTYIEIYLPFIGIRPLKTQDIIGSKVKCKYSVDVYTGTVLAELIITKNNITQTLYQFEGNCSVQIPLTASDRTRMLSGMITGALGGAVTGGVGGAVIGGLGGAVSGGVSIQKQGSISGNSGAMAIKKPYIIITRKKPADAQNYNEIYGYPTNMTVTLKDCKGYTRVKECHIDIPYATDIEKDMIENSLKAGVII